MNVQTVTSELTIDTVKQNGHKRPSSPKSMHLHELSPMLRLIKTLAGITLFLGWLLLFIMGMSLDAVHYSKYLMDVGHTVNWSNLVVYGLLFTPTNGAVLASLAGVLGGIASNLTADNKFRHVFPDFTDTNSSDFQSYMYMTENPLVSMLRGFVTYLIFIAGSYLTNFTTSADTNDPSQFLGLTASAYFKFAVSVSLLAYLAGYDPSRMKSLVNSYNLTRKDPDPLPQGNFSKHIHKEKDININGRESVSGRTSKAK